MRPDRNWGLRIEDILESIARIKAYTGDLDFESFAWDERTVDAVLRHFGVIGEAANHVPEPIRSAHPEIPWDAMRAMRNFVIHEYFGVSKAIVWKTLTDELPPLENALQSMLRELE